MLLDPNFRRNQWDDEWNSEEVQSEIQFTGITREEWEQNRAMDGIESDEMWF